MPGWIWIPLVLAAAAAQTVRNAAQRSLVSTAGTLPATFVRFFYGLPFAIVGYLAVAGVASGPRPHASVALIAWVAIGSIMQLAATAFLLAAMKQRSFIVAVAYSKTELVQIVIYSVLLLGEAVSAWTMVAIVLATAGVLLLSIKAAEDRTFASARAAEGAERARPWARRLSQPGWVSPAAFLGLACGACFALSAVGYRGATRVLEDVAAPLAGTYCVVWGQALQSALLGLYLLGRDRAGLQQVIVQWRVSTLAGAMGALASMGWLTAFAMRSAADVRTVGLVEVLYGYAVSRRFFSERVSGRELTGIALVAAGILVISVGQR